MEITLVTPVAIHGDAVAGESAQLRNQLETLIDNVNKSAFDISDLCFKVKTQGHYAKWGFTTAQDYFKTLPIKKRRIQYLTKIAEVMHAVGIERKDYEPVGIAKLREITSLNPKEIWKNPETGNETPIAEFIKGFIEQHASLDEETIKQHVKTLKGLVGDEDLVFLNLYIKRSVLNAVGRPALDLAKAHIGSVGKDDEGISQDPSDGAAFEVLAVSFLNDPQNSYEALNATVDEEVALQEEEQDVIEG